jgi:psiF repeat-containing protein
MKHLIIALSFCVAAGATFARGAHAPAAAPSDPTAVAAAGATQPGTPQRSKMKTCNADAKTKGVHGADRRAFMKQCLSGKAKPATAS